MCPKCGQLDGLGTRHRLCIKPYFALAKSHEHFCTRDLQVLTFAMFIFQKDIKFKIQLVYGRPLYWSNWRFLHIHQVQGLQARVLKAQMCFHVLAE
jgi:hypothetical protein